MAGPVAATKRYELKYLIDDGQRAFLLQRLGQRLPADPHGASRVYSLYYDTPDHRLIRTSLERPAFKEKLRLRSYGIATDTSPVFLEMKRKADGVVYKRRVQTTVPQAERFFAGEGDICAEGQINAELVYFRDYYGVLTPACLIDYDRTAFFDPETDIRVTLDDRPFWRFTQLDLRVPGDGAPLLPPGGSVLEIKAQQALPLWLTAALDEARIYKRSFSKYGEAYRQHILSLQKGK